jgi:serine protease Do
MRSTPFFYQMLLISFIGILFVETPGDAEIYKFKDEKGVWHFTDAPDSMPEDTETIHETGQRAVGLIDAQKKLETALTPSNKIEQASMATVAVKSAIGYGSGFFITGQGHIITNRHVLQYTKDQEEADNHIETLESRMEAIEAELVKEDKRIATVEKELGEARRSLEKQKDSEQKKFNESRYRSDLELYKSWKKNFGARKESYELQKKEFQEKQFRYKREAGIAALSRSFTIFLADNTEVQAYLVKLSDNHDLALLKIDGYKTPFLKSAPMDSVAKGNDVYAIGNPVRLKNSVAKGSFSGFEGNFAKTDAKIYPGNSGGPLVTSNGQVIGVNTFKKLTHKFEGLGFALQIQHVLAEFDSFLP